MAPFWVAGDGLEPAARVEMYAPLRLLEMVSRDRKLGEGNAAPCAPDDDAATILRRPVDRGLQDVEADLIAVTKNVSGCANVEGDEVPKRGQGTKYELDDAIRGHLSLLRAWLVDLELVIEEAKHVLQEEEFGLVKLRKGEHVAHQRVSAT